MVRWPPAGHRFLKIAFFSYRSEGFALTGYVVPGCVEDGTWMLWENSSAVAVAAVAVARSFLDKFLKQIIIFSHFL